MSKKQRDIGIDLTDAINSEINEYKKLDDKLIVNFLKSLI